jgi:hypothetical protein
MEGFNKIQQNMVSISLQTSLCNRRDNPAVGWNQTKEDQRSFWFRKVHALAANSNGPES